MTHRNTQASAPVIDGAVDGVDVGASANFEHTAGVLRKLARIEAAPAISVIERRGQRQLHHMQLEQLVEIERAATRAKRGVLWTHAATTLCAALAVVSVAATGAALQPQLVQSAGEDLADAFALGNAYFASTASAELNPGDGEPEEEAAPVVSPRPRAVAKPKPKPAAPTASSGWFTTDCSADPYDPLNGCLL